MYQSRYNRTFVLNPFSLSSPWKLCHMCIYYWEQYGFLWLIKFWDDDGDGGHYIVTWPRDHMPPERTGKEVLLYIGWCGHLGDIQIQLSAVIKRSKIVRYCINIYRNWGKILIRCWINKRYPIPRELWGVFCEYEWGKWPRNNGTALYFDPCHAEFISTNTKCICIFPLFTTPTWDR